jgi:hypothetical protein
MSIRVNRTRILVGAGVIGIAIAGALWGRHGSVSPAAATQPPQASDPVPPISREGSDYSKQVVAYLYDNKVALTREEFGEYLIARCGVGDRLNNMVNRYIIEYEARQRGIEVSAAEVEAEFNETLRGINTNKTDFVNTVLKPYHKTLYEWKEDVIKPRLMLTKMCRQRVTATEEEIHNGYEAYYGEKIHCRIIKWDKKEQNIAIKVWPTIRDSEEEFDKVAKHQATAELAAKGGEIAPFGRYTTGNLEMEKEAFALKPGEITKVIESPESFVVLKCIERIPPTHAKTLDEARAELTADIIRRKIDKIEIPKMFAEIREKAHAKVVFKEGAPPEDIMGEVRKELQTPVSGSGGTR